jgi:hypothetical protein
MPTIDYDMSGKCYVTDHSQYEDVDNGEVVLYSPVFDVSFGKTIFEYARCFDNGDGLTGNSDVFRVSIFDGSQWIQFDSCGPVEESPGEWIYRRFWVHEICQPTGPVQFRFSASDEGFDSEVEAAVDAFCLVHYSSRPQILTNTIPDEFIDIAINHQLDATGCYEPLIWTDKDDDLIGTGLSLSGEGLLSGLPADTGEISFTALVEDAEGVPAEKTYNFHIWLPFVCGDAGMDYQLNLGDAVFLINYVFNDGQEPYPLCVGDANGDSDTNVGDAVYIIAYIFDGGPAPVDDCCL